MAAAAVRRPAVRATGASLAAFYSHRPRGLPTGILGCFRCRRGLAGVGHWRSQSSQVCRIPSAGAGSAVSSVVIYPRLILERTTGAQIEDYSDQPSEFFSLLELSPDWDSAPLHTEGWEASKLFRAVRNTTGVELEPVEFEGTSLSRSLLELPHSYVVSGAGVIWLWESRQGVKWSRMSATVRSQWKLQDWQVIEGVREGSERVVWEYLFPDSPLPPLPQSFLPPVPRVAPSRVQRGVAVEDLLLPPLPSHTTSVLVDRGEDLEEEIPSESQLEMWVLTKIMGPAFAKLPTAERGHLFSGDAYMLLHNYYDAEGNYRYHIFFW